MSDSGVIRVRLFLDANVLISAAWKDGSKVCRLWRIEEAELVASNYVVVECKRNLPRADQQERLIKLLAAVRILEFQRSPILENAPPLPEKDQHVLAAAVLSRADFLVTGDRKHFGHWYGATIFGMRVEPPGRFPQVLEGGSPRRVA
jgi:predicted nucleic acid-binding protein